MANQISYAKKYSGDIDKMITQTAKVGFLADNAFKARFAGSKTVLLPEINMVGLGNYDRINGFAKGDATLTHTPYELTQERSRQLFIDAQDADESGVPDLAGTMVGEYTRTQVIPEIDAYSIFKMYAVAEENGNTSVFSEATAVADLLDTINSAEEAVEYDGTVGMVALVDSALYNLLMTSQELDRIVNTNEFKQGEINLKVKNINGCDIIPVSSGRMMSKYVFADGSDASTGGFAPAEDAKKIHAVVLPKDGASLVKKVDKVDMHAPGDDVNRDGYIINYRLYYDLIVKNSKKNTIFAIAE